MANSTKSKAGSKASKGPREEGAPQGKSGGACIVAGASPAHEYEPAKSAGPTPEEVERANAGSLNDRRALARKYGLDTGEKVRAAGIKKPRGPRRG